MIISKNSINTTRKTILVAPMDWGLGHATRCIPIIRELQIGNNTIIIAATGAVKNLLQQEFPALEIIPLQGYNIKFSNNKKLFALKIFTQLPKILFTIIHEKRWLKKAIKKYKIDLVIADNRPGLYHAFIPTVYITHQLCIKTGNCITENIASTIHRYFINKFKYCWVPDFEGTENIAGELSHSNKKLKHVKYIGGLSRFEPLENIQKEFDLLIILSGPEPQRTIFENILLSQLDNFNGTILFVRGIPGQNNFTIEIEKLIALNNQFVFKNHLTAIELCKAIQQSKMVISRSGYTTVMDLLKLGQPAILVPTPGQAEQEYLASYLSNKNIFYFIQQENFLLKEAIAKATAKNNCMPMFEMELYKKTIQQLQQLL